MLTIQYCCLYYALDLQDLSTSYKCIALNKISSIPAPAPGNFLSTLCFHEFGSFRLHIEVISYSVCPPLSDLPHLKNVLKVHPCCRKWQDFITSDYWIIFPLFDPFIHWLTGFFNGHIDQWNRLESPEFTTPAPSPSCQTHTVTHTHTHTHTWSTNIYSVAKNPHWRNDTVFNDWYWKNKMTKCRKIKFNPYLTPLTKIDPKQIQGLNIRPDVIKLLEQNRKKSFLHWSWQWYFGYDSKNRNNKNKSQSVELYQPLKLLHCKRKNISRIALSPKPSAVLILTAFNLFLA